MPAFEQLGQTEVVEEEVDQGRGRHDARERDDEHEPVSVGEQQRADDDEHRARNQCQRPEDAQQRVADQDERAGLPQRPHERRRIDQRGIPEVDHAETDGEREPESERNAAIGGHARPPVWARRTHDAKQRNAPRLRRSASITGCSVNSRRSAPRGRDRDCASDRAVARRGPERTSVAAPHAIDDGGARCAPRARARTIAARGGRNPYAASYRDTATRSLSRLAAVHTRMTTTVSACRRERRT